MWKSVSKKVKQLFKNKHGIPTTIPPHTTLRHPNKDMQDLAGEALKYESDRYVPTGEWKEGAFSVESCSKKGGQGCGIKKKKKCGGLCGWMGGCVCVCVCVDFVKFGWKPFSAENLQNFQSSMPKFWNLKF